VSLVVLPAGPVAGGRGGGSGGVIGNPRHCLASHVGVIRAVVANRIRPAVNVDEPEPGAACVVDEVREPSFRPPQSCGHGCVECRLREEWSSFRLPVGVRESQSLAWPHCSVIVTSSRGLEGLFWGGVSSGIPRVSASAWAWGRLAAPSRRRFERVDRLALRASTSARSRASPFRRPSSPGGGCPRRRPKAAARIAFGAAGEFHRLSDRNPLFVWACQRDQYPNHNASVTSVKRGPLYLPDSKLRTLEQPAEGADCSHG
jgi:hypothetical protein